MSNRPTPRRAVSGVALLMAVLLTTGCTVPRPDVTFYGNRLTVDAAPTLWCAVDSKALTIACPTPDPSHVARLALRPGDGVQISVPTEVGDTPWGVYVQYATPNGKVLEARTSFFTDGRLAFTLNPPTTQDQILRVEVQAGLVPTAGQSAAQVDFAATRSWVLLVTAARRVSASG